MQTKDLSKRVDILKNDIQNLLFDFNQQVGLDISQVMASAVSAPEIKKIDDKLTKTEIICNYDIQVGIDI